MNKINKMNTAKRLYIGKGRRKQKGELSLVEAAGVMAAAALIALVVYMGRGYVMDRIHAMQFKSEAQYFVSGIQDATAGEIDFSSVTMLSLTQNRAFDTAGRRLNKTTGALTGIFGGAVTAAPATVTATNDAIAVTYPIPATVCALAADSISEAYTQVKVNNTTISGPATTFNSGTAATACASAGATANVIMYASKRARPRRIEQHRRAETAGRRTHLQFRSRLPPLCEKGNLLAIGRQVRPMNAPRLPSLRSSTLQHYWKRPLLLPEGVDVLHARMATHVTTDPLEL